MRSTPGHRLTLLALLHLGVLSQLAAQGPCAATEPYTGEGLDLSVVADSIVDAVATRLKPLPIDIVIILDSAGNPIPDRNPLDVPALLGSLSAEIGQDLPLALIQIMLEQRSVVIQAVGAYLDLAFPAELLRRALGLSQADVIAKLSVYWTLSDIESPRHLGPASDTLPRLVSAARIRFVCSVASAVRDDREVTNALLEAFATMVGGLEAEVEDGNEGARELLADPLLLAALRNLPDEYRQD
jgi:hypothetical protein